MLKYLFAIVIISGSCLSAIHKDILEIGRRMVSSRLCSTMIKDSAVVVPVNSGNITSFAKFGLKQFERQFVKHPTIWPSGEDVGNKFPVFIATKVSKPNATGYGILKNNEPVGFLLGHYVTPPEVYDPGLTLLITEAHFEDNLWSEYVPNLLAKLRREAREKGATQWVFTNDSVQDTHFDDLMKSERLNICSQWWAGQPSRANDLSSIQPLEQEDLEEVVAMSAKKRKDYSLVQPLFWKPGPKADEVQYKYLSGLIKEQGTLGLVLKKNKSVEGFIIGELYPSGPLYSGFGLCKVDDYMIKDQRWETTGHSLLSSLHQQSLIKGVNNLYIVSGYHDLPKKEFLARVGLKKVSDWWTGAI